MGRQRGICSIPDCGRPHSGLGYCLPHWKRYRRHGDPLGGRTPTGEPMRFVHEVAIYYQGADCLIWPFSCNNQGYGQLNVDGKTTLANRYVCELTKGPPPTPGHEAAHNCGKGHEGCINPHHLEWKTHVDNIADQLIHGTHHRGERQGASKLTEAQVITIRRLRGVKTQRELAAEYGVVVQTISDVQRRTTWAWLEDAA